MVFPDPRQGVKIPNPFEEDDEGFIYRGPEDPGVEGVRASIGSLFLRTTGQVYRKSGTTNTDWLELQSGAGGASLNRLSFVAATWAAGVADEITIIQSGVPGAGEIGPHGFVIADSYVVQVFDTDATPTLVDTEVTVDSGTGDITLAKVGGSDFDGTVIITGVL